MVSLVLVLLPMTLFAEPVTVENTCSHLQFYVANCSKQYVLKEAQYHCTKGALTLTNNTALSADFIGFSVNNTEKDARNIECRLIVGLGKKGFLYSTYTIDINVSINKAGQCSVENSTILQNESSSNNSTSYYSKATVSGTTKYLLGICEKDLKKCKCPPI